MTTPAYPVAGVDVSHYNAPSGDAAAFAGKAFVAARAVYGTTKDDTYDRHEADARAAGPQTVVIAYCFGRSLDGSRQAQALVAAAPHADAYALDRENDGSSIMTLSQASAFFTTLRTLTPKKRLLYASERNFPASPLGQDANWVANWITGVPHPGIPWLFWQPGSTGIDRDVFNGTLPELLAWAGKAAPAPAPKPVPKPPAFTLHIAAGTRSIPVASVTPDGRIAGWTARPWSGRASSAPCRAPVTKPGTKSGSAEVAYVTRGAFAGRWVRVGGPITVTEESPT